MKIKYNALDKSIEINDNLNLNYLGLIFLMVLNISNSILNVYHMKENPLEKLDFFWMVIAVLSVAIIMFLLVKKSILEKIPVEDIAALKEKRIFGSKRFSLELKNGKKRDLIGIITQSEIEKLKKIFNDIGIGTV